MIDEILNRVDDNKERLISLLSDMIKIPSVSGNEQKLAEFINEYCNNAGLLSNIDEHGNVLAIAKGKNAGKRLAFNSHLDTVPVGDGWTFDPFGAEIVENRMYGRGSTDCKAAIASQIIAIISLLESGAKFNGEVALMYPVNEEVQQIEKKGTLKMLDAGFTADMAINGEDTDLDICLACAGMVEVKVTTIGVGAHGGTPFKGKNAISMMSKLLLEIEKIKPGTHKYINGSVNIGVISGGERSSVVPDKCEAKISRFIVPGEKGKDFLAEVIEIVNRLKEEDNSFEALVELTYDTNPSEVSENSEIVKAIVDAHKILNLEYNLTGTPQHDDADFLTNIAKIPTLLYGPGTGLMAHMPDEYVILDEVIEAAKVYAITIYNALN